MKHLPAALVLPLASALAPLATSQGFGIQNNIAGPVVGLADIALADLDGDGDQDLLSASITDGKVALYENLGNGSFGPQQSLSVFAAGANTVSGVDIDGDGDLDVLGSESWANRVVWYENLGGLTFSSQVTVTDNAPQVTSTSAGDLDGDGKVDVLVATGGGNRISWYRNLGNGSFGPPQVVTVQTAGPRFVTAKDMDGDGDIDVLSASRFDAKIAWYENLGAGTFGPQQVLTNQANNAWVVRTPDLDGDGLPDVLAGSGNNGKITWFKNLGGGSFSASIPIAIEPVAAPTTFYELITGDLDGDGDLDLITGRSTNSPTSVTWHENLGNGQFASPAYVTSIELHSRGLALGDFDGDGDLDLASGSHNQLIWHENFVGTCTSAPGVNYCAANPNITGAPATIVAEGCNSVSANYLILHSFPVPNQSGIFFRGLNQVQVPFGNGFLCTNGSIKRMWPAYTINNRAGHGVDLNDPNAPILPGQTWNFQHWYRELGAGAGFNTSDAVSITFTP